jgi:aromatic ring-cleaving dioxygenase
MLTGDIADFTSLSKQYPKLLVQIQFKKYGEGELDASRRQWLKNMHGEQLVSALMETWKQNVVVLVPDPAAASKSDYTEHACWLGVVRELNQADYEQILTHWQKTHKRRRNLWKALQKKGLM